MQQTIGQFEASSSTLPIQFKVVSISETSGQDINSLNEEIAVVQYSKPIVGGDKDEHGCIGSAGYTWCEEKQKCLREWEEPCEIDKKECNTNNDCEIMFNVLYNGVCAATDELNYVEVMTR